MKTLVMILAVGGWSYWMIDARSPSAVRTVLFPTLFVLSLVALALWIYAWSRRREERDSGFEIPSGLMGGGSDD